MRPMLLYAATLLCTVAMPMVAQEAEEVVPMSRADGYRGVWYMNQPTSDEYRYKYSGGLGTYCAKHIPFAVYSRAARKTFFVFGGAPEDDSQHLLIMAGYYDHERHLVPRPTILCDKRTGDAHDNPVISMDSDGHIWVFASSHGTARPSFVYKSREPLSIDAFDLITETNFSYPQVHWIDGLGFFFFHTIYSPARRLFYSTSATGEEWDGPHELSYIEQGHYQVSAPHGTRVGTAFNFHPEPQGLNYRTNLYYLETDDFGVTWHAADGTPIDLPLREVANPALVHDYQSEGLKVYLKDLTYDADGRPVALVIISRGYEPGPENGPRVWTTLRWTGSEWEIRGSIESDNNYDMGSLYIEPDGTWRIIAPTQSGPQPYNPGGEVAMWTSVDQGGAWTFGAALTADSPYNHTYVRRPVNAHPEFYALWADGHGRQPSESRLYFCDQSGEHVYRLPWTMDGEFAEPELVSRTGL